MLPYGINKCLVLYNGYLVNKWQSSGSRAVYLFIGYLYAGLLVLNSSRQ